MSSQALLSSTGSPLSWFDAASWPACFTEFLYGDATPCLPRPVRFDFDDLFASLVDREELEYDLDGDAAPYKAGPNRFDTPDFALVFGDVLRRLALLRGVKAVSQREGYERDLALIAGARSEHCLQALKDASVGQLNHSLDRAAHAEAVPQELRTALKHVLLSTVDVPFSDGHRMNLRHEGHNLNLWHGSLKLFMTCNFADTYSPLLVRLCLDDGRGQLLGAPLELRLDVDEPDMPTLREMHMLCARSPRAQSKFFALMDDLVDRHCLGIDSSSTGKRNFQHRAVHAAVEDNYASSGDFAHAGFAIDELEPYEAQGRGFQHGHRKVISFRSHLDSHRCPRCSSLNVVPLVVGGRVRSCLLVH